MPPRKSKQLTYEDFRRIALGFEGAEEGSHMGAVDIRVGGRIFATLASIDRGFGNVALTPEDQSLFCSDLPDVFVPVAGGWGRMGMTHIVLSKATEEILRGALQSAWRKRIEANKGLQKSVTEKKGKRNK